MIKFFAPAVTAIQAATFVANKSFPMTYYASVYYDPASPLVTTPGFVFEAHVNDEAWAMVKAAIVAMAGTLASSKVRVIFDHMDISRTAGRPTPKIAFVNSDGSQSET